MQPRWYQPPTERCIVRHSAWVRSGACTRMQEQDARMHGRTSSGVHLPFEERRVGPPVGLQRTHASRCHVSRLAVACARRESILEGRPSAWYSKASRRTQWNLQIRGRRRAGQQGSSWTARKPRLPLVPAFRDGCQVTRDKRDTDRPAYYARHSHAAHVSIRVLTSVRERRPLSTTTRWRAGGLSGHTRARESHRSAQRRRIHARDVTRPHARLNHR
jgi:hypothetical protein